MFLFDELFRKGLNEKLTSPAIEDIFLLLLEKTMKSVYES